MPIPERLRFHAIDAGSEAEISAQDGLRVTLPNGVAFLIMADATPDGAAVLHMPPERSSGTFGIFSLEAGAANTLFLKARTKTGRADDRDGDREAVSRPDPQTLPNTP